MLKKEHTYYYIAETYSSKLPTASVVRKDNERILGHMGFRPLLFKHTRPGSLLVKLKRVNELVKFAFSVEKNAVVVFHFPLLANAYKILLNLLGRRGIKTVALIIDIDGLRYTNESLLAREFETLKQFDTIIAHNAAMKNFLSQYISAGKIHSIEMFDYPVHDFSVERKLSNTVCYAGNFEKALFVNEIGNIQSVCFNLYGPAFEGKETQHITYKGIVGSKELPKQLDGSFGLVWDGNTINSCDNYLRYNNPHKLSLYMAAGLPVIVWKESAVAAYVLKNKIGMAVNSLIELSDAIKNISAEDYEMMKRNIEPIRKQIIDGGFLKTVIAKAIG